MKKFIGIAAAALMMMSGTAFAWNNQPTPSSDQAASIYQYGTGNAATIDQAASHEGAAIFQDGSANDAKITQKATEETASVMQFGTGNDAVINQSGTSDTAFVTQKSACCNVARDQANYSDVEQKGSNELALVYQDYTSTYAPCTGGNCGTQARNSALVTQSSCSAVAAVTQVGMANSATINQH